MQKTIFISWSGEQSNLIATALRDWLENVFAMIDIKFWMSGHDISAGTVWSEELRTELQESVFGILCLTPESLKSHWVVFEAGALSKMISSSRVVPYRFELEAQDVKPPLSQFQGVNANKEGTYKLLESINLSLGNPLKTKEQLKNTFEAWWGQFEKILNNIPNSEIDTQRTDRDVLDEVLDTIRHRNFRDLQERFEKILSLENVQNIQISTKQIAQKDTGILSFQIIVKEKLPLKNIPKNELIPRDIYGMPTDIIEYNQVN